MMDEDFNFGDFMEESNDSFNSKLEEWRERLMINAIETNYEKIEENGLSDWHLRIMDLEELKNLNKTLQTMLEYYQDLEEYEKCKLIFDNMKKVEVVMV